MSSFQVNVPNFAIYPFFSVSFLVFKLFCFQLLRCPMPHQASGDFRICEHCRMPKHVNENCWIWRLAKSWRIGLYTDKNY